MLDFSEIRFPCVGEFKNHDSNLMRPCLVVGREAEGSTSHPSAILEYYWLIIDENGDTKKVRNHKEVTFRKHLDNTSR